MPMWCICPVCNKGFSGLTPGDPCSSACSAEQQRRKNTGRSNEDFEGEEVPQGGGFGGSSQGGKCSLVVLAFLGAGAALGYGAFEAAKAIL